MINLLLADDHQVLREALCELLEKKGNYKIVAQASDGDQVLELIKNNPADVIIMDINMPKLNGLDAISKLKEAGIKVPVLILSANENERHVRAALKAGASGFVTKNAGAVELELAINSLVKGQTYLSPSVTNTLMSKGSAEATLDDPLSVLTNREVEIVSHLASGKANREIAKLLHISIRTVDTHRSNIMKKLGVKNNSELTRLAITTGLVNV